MTRLQGSGEAPEIRAPGWDDSQVRYATTEAACNHRGGGAIERSQAQAGSSWFGLESAQAGVRSARHALQPEGEGFPLP